VLCSACSSSRFRKGDKSDWDDCNYEEAASQRTEYRSGRTQRSESNIEPNPEPSADMRKGDGSDKEVSTLKDLGKRGL